jgi:hypothetical protein
MKDRNGPATITRCKETGKCQFIENEVDTSIK